MEAAWRPVAPVNFLYVYAKNSGWRYCRAADEECVNARLLKDSFHFR
jgi:hypothetical protein